MSHPSTLELVSQTASRRRDKAARSLSTSQRRYDDGAVRLASLRNYRSEYAASLDQSTTNGISPQRLANSQAFLASLDRAIAEQAHQTEQHRVARDQEHARWRGHEKRVKAVATVADQRQRDAVRREARADQKHNDEAADRITRFNEPVGQ